MSAEPNRRRIAHYELGPELGRGGMGVVYRARDTLSGRDIALKLLLGQVETRDLARFDQEARALSRLHHPNIVPIHDVGSWQGHSFLAMEFIEGHPASREAKDSPEGQLPWGRVREIAIAVSDALLASHAKGLLHRDLKPENILLRAATGEAVLVDFGLARRDHLAHGSQSDSHSPGSLTGTGEFVGTPLFMAPEQFDREEWGPPSAATDVWGLAVTLYTLLCGAAPFPGRTAMAVAAKQMKGPPLGLREHCPEIPEWLDRLILDALQNDPQARPSMLELHEALLSGPDSVSLAPPARSPRRATAVLALTTVVAILSFAVWIQRRSVPALIARLERAEGPDPTALIALARSGVALDDDRLDRIAPALKTLAAKAEDESLRGPLAVLNLALIRSRARRDGDLAELIELAPLGSEALQLLAEELLRDAARHRLRRLIADGRHERVPAPLRARLEARDQEHQGLIDEAIRTLEAGLDQTPDELALLDDLVRVAFVYRRTTIARAAVERRLIRSPFSLMAASRCLRLIARTDVAEARRRLTELRERRPSPWWDVEAAVLDEGAPPFAPVQSTLTNDSLPERELLLVGLRRERDFVWNTLDDVEQSIELAARIRRLDPDDVDSLVEEAQFLQYQGRYAEVVERVDGWLQGRDFRDSRDSMRLEAELLAALQLAGQSEAFESRLAAFRTRYAGRLEEPLTLNILARVTETDESWPSSLELARRALAQSPDLRLHQLRLMGLAQRGAVRLRGDAKERPEGPERAALMKQSTALSDEAELIARARLRDAPRDVVSGCVLASLLIETGRFEQAEQLTRRLVRVSPGSYDIWNRRVLAMVTAGLPEEECLRVGEEAYRRFPSIGRINQQIASLRWNSGQRRAALMPARVACERFPGDAHCAGLFLNASFAFPDLANLPTLLSLLDHFADAPKTLTQTAECIRAHLDAFESQVGAKTVREHRERTLLACRNALPRAAELPASEARRARTILLSRMGLLLEKLKRHDEAASIWREVVQAEPEDVVWRQRAAAALRTCGRVHEAVQVLLEPVSKREDAHLLAEQAMTLALDCNRSTLAIDAFARLNTLGPVRAGVFAGAAQALLDLAAYERALGFCNQMLQAFPLNIELMSAKVQARLYLGPDSRGPDSGASAVISTLKLVHRDAWITETYSVFTPKPLEDPDRERRRALLLRLCTPQDHVEFRASALRSLARHGRHGKGRLLLRLLSVLTPDDPVTAARLALVEAGYEPLTMRRIAPGDKAESLHVLRRALGLDHRHPDVRFASVMLGRETKNGINTSQLPAGDPGARALIGILTEILSDPRASRATRFWCELQLGRSPTEPLRARADDSPDDSAERYLLQAAGEMWSQRKLAAARTLGELLVKHPDCAIAAIARSQCLLKTKISDSTETRLQEALTAVAQALEVNPNLPAIDDIAARVALATPPGALHVRIEAAIRYAARFTSERAAIEVLGLIARDKPEAAGSRLAAHERTFGRVPILVALRRRMPSIVRDKRR